MSKYPNVRSALVVTSCTFALFILLGFALTPNKTDRFGADVPQTPALYDGYLASGISKTDTSMTVSPGTLKNGQELDGYMCFTLDVNTPQVEYVCGTASGTDITNLERGIDVLNPNATSSDLAYSHRRFATVTISDYPTIQSLVRRINGTDAISDTLKYEAGVTPSGNNDIADVEYVLSVVNGGTVSFDQLIVTGDAGETIAQGDLLYFDDTDQEWKRVDSDDSDTFQNRILGIAQSSGADGSVIDGGVLIYGRDTTQTSMGAGDVYYAASSPGAISTSQSPQPIGQAESDDVLYFNPKIIDVPQLGYDNTWRGDNTWNGENTFTSTTTFTGDLVGVNDVQVFTSDGTWRKPTSSRFVQVYAIGGGGGGGGGGIESSNNHTPSGAGGQGGGLSGHMFHIGTLPDEVTVTVGQGGGGGSGKAPGSDGSGTAGSDGGDSSFGTYLIATGGDGGSVEANDDDLVPGGSGKGIGNIANGGDGGSGQNYSISNRSSAPNVQNFAPTGGGGGGGLSGAGTGVNVRTGGSGGSRTAIASLPGGSGGAEASDGGNGSTFSSRDVVGGTGGGGGGGVSGSGQNPGDGGDGRLGGGGGGGGGSYNQSSAGGNGGNGGDGIVVVFTY